jgi:hypothetical protein
LTRAIDQLGAAAAEDPAAAPSVPPGTAWGRLAVSAVALVLLAAGLFGLVAGVQALRVVGLGGYLLFGLGAAPWTLSRWMDLWLRLVLSVGGSLAVLVLGSTVMLQLDAWHPDVLATVLCAVTAPLHVFGLVTTLREANLVTAVRESMPHVPTRLKAVPAALVLAVVGAAMCAVAALTHRHLDPGIWGFLVQIGPLWYIGLGLCLASLALARSTGERTMAAGVVLLMLVLNGTPALVYDGPRIQSAIKHLELVQQIRLTHHLDSAVAVYNGWPGFFTAMAWLSDVTGVHDPIGFATAWPVLIGVIRLIAMRFLAGQILKDRVQAWLAVALVFLADTVGQDYYSPQSVGLVIGLMAFGIALADLPLRWKVITLTVAGCTIGVEHQLSPFAVGGVLGVLVIFRQIRPWWLPATILVPSFAWAGLHWGDVQDYLDFNNLGHAGNFRPPTTAVTPGLDRLPVLTETLLALFIAVLIVGLIALVVLIRHRRERAYWAYALCPGVGLVLTAVNPYGNEGIFRSILFGLPWLAVLAAQAFRTVTPRLVAVPRLTVILALTSTFLVSSFGMDASNVVRPADRTALARFEASNPGSDGATYMLVLGGGSDLPATPLTSRPLHIVKADEIDSTGFRLTNTPPGTVVEKLTEATMNIAGGYLPAGHLYALWSPVSQYNDWAYGLSTRAQFASLRDAFASSSSWRVDYSADDTVLFEYTGGVAR